MSRSILNFKNVSKLLEDISKGKVELDVCDLTREPTLRNAVKIEKDTENIRINLLQSDLKSLEKFEIIENKDFNLFQSIMKSQDNIEEEKIESVLNNGNTVGLQIYKTIIKPTLY